MPVKAKPKVLVAGNLLEPSLANLYRHASVTLLAGKPDLATLLMHLPECQALVVANAPPITKEVLAAAPFLRLVANVAVGFDNIDVQFASQRGIVVTNTPGVLDDSVADFAFALMLAAARRICQADRFVRDGLFDGFGMELFLGADIHHKTLGIIGLGRIGKKMARRAAGFSMKVLYSANPQSKNNEFDTTYGAQAVSLEELLAQSDFISLHCPLSEATYHLIGKKELALLRPDCILVNTARGKVVDEKALVEALKQGRLAGAALDVFEHEPEITKALLDMENVVLAPHIASASLKTRQAMCLLAVKGLIEAFSGKMPENIVNSQVWHKFCLT